MSCKIVTFPTVIWPWKTVLSDLSSNIWTKNNTQKVKVEKCLSTFLHQNFPIFSRKENTFSLFKLLSTKTKKPIVWKNVWCCCNLQKRRKVWTVFSTNMQWVPHAHFSLFNERIPELNWWQREKLHKKLHTS